MAKTINMTVDVTTHRLWGIVAKKLGLTKIDTLRTLVAIQAKNLNVKVPKALEVNI